MALAPAPSRASFTSTKLPTWTSASSRAPGRSRAYGPTLAPRPTVAPSRWENERITRAVLDRDARAEHHVGLDDDIAAELGVGAEIARYRGRSWRRPPRGRRRAAGVAARPPPRQAGPGVLTPRTSSSSVSSATVGKPILRAICDRIGQIELALGVVIPDPLQDRERAIAAQRHQPGIAQTDGALLRARVLLLADGDEGAVRCDDQAPVAGRIGRTMPRTPA